MKLDRTKPYGTVYGDADHAFEQDGRLFDHNGDEIGVPTPKVDRAPKATKAEAQEDAELAAQLKA